MDYYQKKLKYVAFSYFDMIRVVIRLQIIDSRK